MTEKKDLLRFIGSGSRGTGSELELLFSQAAAKAKGALWEREFAAMTLRGLEKSFDADQLSELSQRIALLRLELKRRDDLEIGPFRARLRNKDFPREALFDELSKRPTYEWDPFVQRLLNVDTVPARETERPAGMVHYLPSPMDAIFALCGTLSKDDVFYDIGSGLGLVTMLVSWLAGVKAKGVEIEPAYHERALALLEAFGFGGVEYICADARTVDYSDGTVFYIYDTFRGDILTDMIDVLKAMSKKRTIRVISRGESNRTLETVPWLEKIGELPSKLVVLQGRIG